MTDASWQAQHLIFERMVRAMMGCPVPVIAAVNGAAYGGGCEIAAASDFVYAASHARFALTEVTLGIMPGAGGTQNLPRAVGERRAKELILTGLPFTAASRSLGAGNECSAIRTVAGGTRDRRAHRRNGPMSVRQAKKSIHRGLQLSLSDGIALEIEAYNRLVPTADRREGVLAFNEKRKPNFKGPEPFSRTSRRVIRRPRPRSPASSAWWRRRHWRRSRPACRRRRARDGTAPRSGTDCARAPGRHARQVDAAEPPGMSP